MRCLIHRVLVGIAAVLSLSATLAQAPTENAYVLRPDRVFDGREMHDGWIVAVQQDRIVGAGPRDRVEIPARATMIDLPEPRRLESLAG